MVGLAPRLRTAALAAAGLLSFCACRVQRTPVVPVIDVSRVRLEVDPEGPWREAAAPDGGTPSEAGGTGGAAAAEPPSAPARRHLAEAAARRRGPTAEGALPEPPPQRPPPAPTLAVPLARGAGEVAERGAPPTKPVEAVGRERFLDHPTEIHAGSLTLVVPAALAAQARLTGAQLSEPTPGRRVAEGGARLTCRELTLVGERITLRVRPPGSEDVQITARGEVELVSRQRDQVLRETGLKSLIVTNDQLMPLR